MVYTRGAQQAARWPQHGPPSHLVLPLLTLWFFPIMYENSNPTVYVKKINFSCGPARCLKLVIWPTNKKMLQTPSVHHRSKFGDWNLIVWCVCFNLTQCTFCFYKSRFDTVKMWFLEKLQEWQKQNANLKPLIKNQDLLDQIAWQRPLGKMDTDDQAAIVVYWLSVTGPIPRHVTLRLD